MKKTLRVKQYNILKKTQDEEEFKRSKSTRNDSDDSSAESESSGGEVSRSSEFEAVVVDPTTKNSYHTIVDSQINNLLRTSVKGVGNITLGIKNLGNTCFFNSTIQCLMATRPFLNYLLNCQDQH